MNWREVMAWVGGVATLVAIAFFGGIYCSKQRQRIAELEAHIERMAQAEEERNHWNAELDDIRHMPTDSPSSIRARAASIRDLWGRVMPSGSEGD